jgi:hypothetical protein
MKQVVTVVFNQAEIAHMLAVERETISRWKNNIEDPLPCHRDSGGDGSEDEFIPSAVVQWFIRHEIKKKRGWR